VEHTQMHPILKKGTENLYYTSNTCGIFCDCTFHETKILTKDMKVQMYSNLSKKKISKKLKSPSSMRNGRFNTFKCRGQASKIGDDVYSFSQKPWAILQTSKKKRN
jgi:hypothetical protein